MELEYDKEILELVAKPIKNDLNCLISVSNHKLLRADLVIFKVIFRKWFKRFHTSQISRRFSLINSRINQFVKLDFSNEFYNKLGGLIREKYDTRTGKLEYPTYDHVTWIMHYSIKTCKILIKLINDIISVFEDCALWIKLGHFARQMRIITAAVSRLSIFFKTIVMKICDIYPYLYSYLELIDYVRLGEERLNKDIFHFLKTINVDAPKNQEIKSSSKVKFNLMYGNKSKRNEDVGQKISRNLFNEKIKNKSSKDKEMNGKLNQNESSIEDQESKQKSSKNGLAYNFLINESLKKNGLIHHDSLDTQDSINLKESKVNKNSKLNFKILNGTFEEGPFFDSNNNQQYSEEKSTKDKQFDVLNGVDMNENTDGDSHVSQDKPAKIWMKLNNSIDSNAERNDSAIENHRKSKKKSEDKNQTEIRILMKEFKRKQKLKKALRRREIRKSMQFEVE